MRTRDIALILLAGFAMLLSLQKSSYALVPAWSHTASKSLTSILYATLRAEAYPHVELWHTNPCPRPPVQLLLNGSEILVIAGDDGTVETVRNGEVQRSSTLGVSKVSRGRKPVALAAGFTDSSALIVVLTQAWHVVCWDTQLKLKWETILREEIDLSLEHVQPVVLITPKPALQGDGGMIIVASSMLGNSSTGLRHFSYYALDSTTGALRWKHEAGDFQERTHSDAIQPYIARSKHKAEADWHEFARDMRASLPHRFGEWHRVSMELGHFARDSEADHATVEPSLPANVILTHNRNGIEAVHLYSGRMVTRMHLPVLANPTSYADINYDSVPDAVQLIDSCVVRVMTGYPPSATIWTARLCENATDAAQGPRTIDNGVMPLVRDETAIVVAQNSVQGVQFGRVLWKHSLKRGRALFDHGEWSIAIGDDLLLFDDARELARIELKDPVGLAWTTPTQIVLYTRNSVNAYNIEARASGALYPIAFLFLAAFAVFALLQPQSKTKSNTLSNVNYS
jgi:hypothetical protein